MTLSMVVDVVAEGSKEDRQTGTTYSKLLTVNVTHSKTVSVDGVSGEGPADTYGGQTE